MSKLYTIHRDRVMSLETAVLLGLPFTTYTKPFFEIHASAAKILPSEEVGFYNIHYRQLFGRSWKYDCRYNIQDIDAAYGRSQLYLVTFHDEESDT